MRGIYDTETTTAEYSVHYLTFILMGENQNLRSNTTGYKLIFVKEL